MLHLWIKILIFVVFFLSRFLTYFQFIARTFKKILVHPNNDICVIFLSKKDAYLILGKVRENETIFSSTKHTSLSMDKNPPSSWIDKPVFSQGSPRRVLETFVILYVRLCATLLRTSAIDRKRQRLLYLRIHSRNQLEARRSIFLFLSDLFLFFFLLSKFDFEILKFEVNFEASRSIFL